MREGLPCPLCECLKWRRNLEPVTTECDFHSRLFHSPCKDCAQYIDSPNCCTFCQHLRIRHLFICLSEWDSSMGEYIQYVNIDLGDIAELQSRQPCPLCQFFYDVITTPYRCLERTIPGKGKRIFLDFTVIRPALIVLDGVQKRTFFSVRDLRKYYSTAVTLSSKIHWSTLREDMTQKLQSHSVSQHISTPRLLQNFLVIDVDSGCIVSKPTSCTYAALSYVWGDSKPGDLQASLANIHDLEKPGALKQAGVPLTIRDSITAASELKIPYLWVDRFCIIQDDAQTKHDLINQMDSIYARAMVTFVAGAGKDASYGLPGVSNERSPGQAHIRIHGMELTEDLPKFATHIIPGMAWNQRGWTYQEARFSKTLIFFTDYGVFYKSTEEFHKISITGVSSRNSEFFESVEAYSGRKLSYETDIEKAFSGVLRSNFGGDHAYGSPLRFFDAALRWTSYLGLGERRRSTNNDIFPSWSWLSVIGTVDFSAARGPRTYLPVATWAMNLPTGIGKSELRFIAPENDEEFKCSASLIEETWKAGFFEAESPSCSGANTASYDRWQPTWKSYSSFWLQSRGLKSISALSQSGMCEKYSVCLRPGQVLVRTKSAHLRTSKFDIAHSRLFDKRVERPCKLYVERSCEGIAELEYVELIALSTRVGSDHEQKLMVDIMAIRRVDGVAYRMGFGWVSLKEWEEAKPAFKTIILG